MSMLLDAVRRERQSQGLDLASHALVLPRTQKSTFWHWLLPALAVLLGAAGSYWLKPLLLRSEPVVQPLPDLILAQEAILPLPNWVPNIQAEISVANLDFYQQPAPVLPPISPPIVAPSSPELPPPPARNKPSVQQPVQPQPQAGQNKQELDLLAALKQAVSDLGEQETFGLNYTPSEPSQLYGDVPVRQPAQQSQPYSVTSDLMQSFQDEIPKLGQLPWALQKRVPDFDITAHIYATNPSERWLRGNGRQLQEGDEIAPGVTLFEILPDEVVLEMEGQKFRIPALGSI